MEDFKHNFKPYRITVKRNFIMKDFLFNNCDICLNPNIIERYVGDNKNYSNSHFAIKTACSNGKWTWGYGIMIHDQGGSCGAGRGSFEKKYATEKEAINGRICKVPWMGYPKILNTLYMKNAVSLVPLLCAKNLLILEFNDSDKALEDLSIK